MAQDEHDGSLVDLLTGEHVPVADDGAATVPLEGYGYRWLRLRTPTDDRVG